ncbi:uncharacterized protein UBRO_08345 [Ustilago bromivora]|uniref:Uncharacterized protein n=1 Tax=Ustilago bromivora TaxID=307758 RepID=A0A1K0GWQ5_9BASI|nr:uncharacterized protein UBRO_08345 [Ustilago bromivora]SYW75839.1 uncharacterized protein UBRO2_00994 [Ustilago bromivora]
MTTPTPAGSSTAAIGFTATSPLAILSNATPRGSSIALSSLQALPETQLVLVLLDHPTIRRKWRTVVVPLVESISKKLNTAFSGSRLTIGCVVYRPTTDKSLLRPTWTLSRTKLQPGSKLIASNLTAPESWLGSEPNASHHTDVGASTYSLIDGRSTAKPTAHVLEAFVAAQELLQSSDNGVHNPLAPKKPPVMARHMLHVCLDSADVALDLTSPPFFNADAANDRVNAPTVGVKLARLGVSISSCAVKADGANGAASTTKEALAAILGIHKSVSEPNKLANEDLAALLPEAIRAKIFSDANIISTGLTPMAGQQRVGIAAAAAPSAKRAREEEGDATSAPVKRSKSGSISQTQPPTAAPAASAPTNPTASSSTAAPPGEIPRNIKLDPSISTKVLFLRSQQETMIKNWAAAYATVSKAESDSSNSGSSPAKAPGMNKAYLEQLKAQLMTQQQALKMLVHRIIGRQETAPNFNVSLQSLINIDKEAKEMGVHLGGPSGGPPGGVAGGVRLGRSGSFTGPQQQQQQQQQQATKPVVAPVPDPVAAANSNANTALLPPRATANVGAPPPSPTRPKPFWRGALTWSVISDPVTKQKRDVATLVSATSNSPSLDRLMMPWPDKLQITAISQLFPRNLQVYAQSQNAPYILFATQEAGQQEPGPVLTAASAEKNKQMYSSLASSLDAKKSCAFIRHGSDAGAGLVLFATTQPTSSAERQQKGPGTAKLIGVVLKDSIPFSKLLAAQSSGAGVQQQSKAEGGEAGRSRGASASGSQLPQVEQQSQGQAVPALAQPQAQAVASGMGLGSSMPFNLAALNAVGNLPVSGVGATGGIGAGLQNNSNAMGAAIGNPMANLGNFNLNQLGSLMAGQQQQAQQDASNQNQSGGQQQPNLAALAQFLGIGGQAATGEQQQQIGGQQQQQQQQQQQALSQLFAGMGNFQPQQQQQVPQQQQQQGAGQGMFNNLNPFAGQQQLQQQQQPQPQQQQLSDAGGGSGGGGMDFSKPMTMEQLRALGFIS